MSATYIYLDSEYNDDAVLCFVAEDCDGNRRDFDTRYGCRDLARYVQEHSASIFVAYSVAAEQTALIRLGIEPPLQWLDLMPEAAQILLTHPAYRQVPVEMPDGDLILVNPRAMGLLEASHWLCGTPKARGHKDAMRDLILSRDSWSASQFADIVEYCHSDVALLPPMHRAIVAFHSKHNSPWTEFDAIYRGRTTLEISRMLFNSPGFPIDVDWLAAIYANRVKIIHAEVDGLDTVYPGYSLFLKTPEGARVNLAECKRFAIDRRLPWSLSEKNQSVILREEYLSVFAKQCPSLKAFKECRDLMVQLSKNRWTEGNPEKYERPLIQDGTVKAVAIPFYTKTGRSQPLVNRGHILNARPFIRTAICAPAGKVIIACDWSQQEIAIGLHFFPDSLLREAYESGDLYLALAIMAGAVPSWGTKKTHPHERQQFKSVQLGLAYGMGPVSLGRKLFADLNGKSDTIIFTLEECEIRANEIYDWHKETFTEYWEAVADFVEETRERGYCTSVDNWVYFADDDTPTTQLQNITMQANGAAMMHFALRKVSKAGLHFLAEHHDAIYILADVKGAAQAARTLRAIMDEAAALIIGEDIKIKAEPKFVRPLQRYQDERANRMVSILNNHLKEAA